MSTAIEEAAVTEEATKPARKTKAAPTADMFDLSSIAPISKPRRADQSFSMLLFGQPKTGKTLLSGTAADVEELSPVLVLAVEDGSSVLANGYEDIDVIEIQDWPTAAKVIEAVASGKTKYKTIVVDTLGELQEHMKNHITRDGTSDMRIQDWGTIKDSTVNVVKLLHRSPVNSIFITHSEKQKDENTGTVTTQPVLLGKASLGEVPKVVDIIAYLAVAQNKETKENVRVLQTGTDGKIDAGDRFGKLAYQIVNPTMQEVYAQLTK